MITRAKLRAKLKKKAGIEVAKELGWSKNELYYWAHKWNIPCTGKPGRRSSKYTKEDVQLIRALKAEGIKMTVIARKFELSYSTVRHLCDD